MKLLTEPQIPSADAPTLEWFSYYRQIIEFLRRDVPRLKQIEAAALRVASSRRNAVVTDQAVLDALDAALQRRRT